MTKEPDKYLETDPWEIREEGFHPRRSRVSESLFSLANEYMGIRGHFDEGYGGDRLVGSYVNGVFEEKLPEEAPGYRGISEGVRFMVNTVDWSAVRLSSGTEHLDLDVSRYSEFVRRLDFRSGCLSRTFRWHLDERTLLECRFERILSMDRPHMACQRLTFRAVGREVDLQAEFLLDFSPVHEAYRRNYWTCADTTSDGGRCSIMGTTTGMGHRLRAEMRLSADRDVDWGPVHGDRMVGTRIGLRIPDGDSVRFDREVALIRERPGHPSPEPAWAGYDATMRGNRKYWAEVWNRSDIRIDGDPVNQQGIRFSIFQLEQSYRGASEGTNIGAKGLTGEAYNGNAFWDTEVYCLPYYLFSNPRAARRLLDFRYDTLGQAMERASQLDCRGACFPVATIDGTESCNLWQHASLQFQPSTGVAYAVSHYVRMTGDWEFMIAKGLELLIQVSRFLASRAQWSERKRCWGFFGVMGPDEFQMMVNHNAYTNAMARWTLETTLAAIEEMERENPEDCSRVLRRTGCDSDERRLFAEVSAGMHIPRDDSTGIIEQHEGYFDLPHVNIDAIPVEEFPLYHSWSYDRIYRNDMIKQPDVLMLLFLLNGAYSQPEKAANYDFYEPRCIHESSLSPSVHSILAAELGRYREALDFFAFATRIDLDDYNRNTREGLHVTAISGAWMNIVYGFGGFRSDGALPRLDPVLPTGWESYAFRLRYRGSLVSVEIGKDSTRVNCVEGGPVDLIFRGERHVIDRAGSAFPTRKAV